MNIKESIFDKVNKFDTAPFLFLGSGFSRRYIGLDNWENLLRSFCLNNNLKAFEYYNSSSNGKLAVTAKLIANEFKDIWWEHDDYLDARNNEDILKQMINVSSPMKYEISKILKEYSILDSDHVINELNDLRDVYIDGVITTNWDGLLEELFDEYEVYNGQTDLINLNSYQIGDIYKIHGSIYDFNSMILTSDDYENFNSKNAYLAAKLLTIFVEHPVFFIGYSLSDPNIIEILEKIAYCVSDEGLKQLKKNLFFVERLSPSKEKGIRESVISIGGSTIPITTITTDNFSDIYEPLKQRQRKIPVRILKMIKSQLYNIVKTNDPQNRLALIDIDSVDNYDEIDFVMGVGIKELHEKGLVGIDKDDIYEDIVFNNRNFNAQDIVTFVLPKLLRYQLYTPYRKYLNEGGYLDNVGNLKLGLDKRVVNYFNLPKETLITQSIKEKIKKGKIKDYDYTLENVINLRAKIHLEGKGSFDIDKIEEILRNNYESYIAGELKQSHKSNYNALIRIYDWIKYS